MSVIDCVFMKSIHLKIIHRNRLFRECLVSVLSDVERFRVTEADHNADDCLTSLALEQPDIVLIDLSLPERQAVQLTTHIREHLDQVKIIVLGHAKSEEENLLDCIAAGAHGCVLEESSLQELETAVKDVTSGKTFCSPEIVQSMFSKLAQTARQSHWRERVERVDLTPRELEVVQLIAKRLSNKHIAKELSLSLYTVKNHVHNIIEKLQVEDRFEAVEQARQRRWLRKTE